ncbi:MAG: hypothetical protein GY785_13150 [Gammaproteobacteria bacterium]|nr:hypothetical protein [Gammaproteobacteria bacterium]
MNEAVALEQNPDLEKLIGEGPGNYVANNPNSKLLYDAAKDVMPIYIPTRLPGNRVLSNRGKEWFVAALRFQARLWELAVRA